ncbi:NAD(P)/FAD-dependent oxidoreductase [Brumimicrobium aurantiacum]|uniref:NAD(P)/FAD-dependent oxidoreductase n=1 Tax=Brumimicrobium aurantiacum TaxID=1737063 RepID=A0A3E1EVX5_9FLAO|nr:FAD/NAD(P)-binding oxidoreductase [Brumimicrobium aurantiacum]RFC53643.1 NAD(P)/FAD-dependent oxidoreductase [Brumimicrobium aurantiacum]
MQHIVIIGNGIAGVTAARHIRKKSDKNITIISSESKYFFSRTALMYVYMGHMRFEDIQPYENHFWQKNRIDLIEDYVENVDFESKTLKLAQTPPIHYDKLILATGSKPNKFGWKGQDYHGVQGLYSKKDLDLMEMNTRGIKEAVLVGGGLIGVEMAEMLLSRGIDVKFLIREATFWGNALPKEDSHFVTQHLRKHHGLTLMFEEELDEIIPDESKRAKAIKTKSGKTIPCQFVGLAAGVSPNVDFLKKSALELDRGILVEQDLSTNQKDVYAIGDCAQFRKTINDRGPLEQVWYTGRMMGETVAQTICGNHLEYKPGHWFNSAKFFDLEYQTYGRVWAKPKEHESRFVWKNDEKEVLLHFVFDKETNVFIGVNTFGLRLRHELFDQWLNEKRSIQYVLQNLKSANFDPEFYTSFEKEIVEAFNQEFDDSIEVSSKKWWRKLLNQ